MDIVPIDDSNSDFDKVELADPIGMGRETPHCREHGAMNKVSKFKEGGGFWRCVAVAEVVDEETGERVNEDCRAGCIQRG